MKKERGHIDAVLTHSHHVKSEWEKQHLLSEVKNKIAVCCGFRCRD